MSALPESRLRQMIDRFEQVEARMGVATDPMAVLDHRLRLRGIDGLRVIDASAMPLITSGNTAAPTMMIAEKGAAMIIEDAGR